MYRGFNIELKESFEEKNSIQRGKSIVKETENELEDSLQYFYLKQNIINGNKVIEDWFPVLEYDIFLSHSHRDEDLALALGGYLYDNYGLKTFIDSTVWKFSDILLKFLDNKYCKSENGETYDYHKRNYSTSHVHLMLKSALDKMIDKCEAIFFLNTPNSISANSSVVERTRSPWIFSEIATTQIIRKNTPKRLIAETRLFSAESAAMLENTKTQLNIEYQLELNHFTKIDEYDLNYWYNNYNHTNENPLDVLYRLKPINKKFLI